MFNISLHVCRQNNIQLDFNERDEKLITFILNNPGMELIWFFFDKL